MHDGGDLPREWLAPSSSTGDNTLGLNWLSDEILEGVLFEARQMAGFSQRHMTRYYRKDRQCLEEETLRLPRTAKADRIPA